MKFSLNLSFLIFCCALNEIHGFYLEARADENDTTWDFFENGTDTWGERYRNCSINSTRQSPILLENISNYRKIEDKLVYEGYTSFKNMILRNKGYTVQLELSDTDTPAYISGAGLGAKYQLRQIHFHWGLNNTNGSEHVIRGGKRSVMEMHLVHTNPNATQNGSAGIAVVGVLFSEEGLANAKYQLLTTRLSDVIYRDQTTNIRMKLMDLLHFKPNLDGNINLYRYNGSLTTPPCTEGVIWSVYETLQQVSQTQMNAFRRLRKTLEGDTNPRFIAPNFRPLQNVNNREILRYLAPF